LQAVVIKKHNHKTYVKLYKSRQNHTSKTKAGFPTAHKTTIKAETIGQQSQASQSFSASQS